MMKKILPILVLLGLVLFIVGCGPKVTEPETPPTTDTSVDGDLDDVGGELNDFDELSDEDYGLDDINIDEDLPPL